MPEAPGFRSALVEDGIRDFGIEHPNGPGFNLIRARADKTSADCFREVTKTTKQQGGNVTFLTTS
ncbi:hypothetical protein [Accumulibacter sp.]|uniref:hypothetical protein n=1 Tax=Accumulibacter sp. TaxID=2053492 RepID=UPI001A422D41|nr:hypothetical protein [Accumulibacter sp.]MBL8374766.1 hypothetical protein [Accumulibacter sp.]